VNSAFIGSRCIVVEGVHVGKEAVLGLMYAWLLQLKLLM
jgi:tetrahydrodipicolinate N-succinyltransferase